MAKAIRLARRGLFSTHPNPQVGCVIVRGNKCIGEGWHEYPGGPHAEINALKALGPENTALASDIYITLEPCSYQGKTPPCVDALVRHKPKRVIIAMQDPNPLVAGASVAKLRHTNIEVIVGVLAHEAQTLNAGFMTRFDKKRPFLRLKMAISLDGRTALKNGQSQWITAEPARRDVQFLRARSSAILTSAETILIDNPGLDVRLSQQDLRQSVDVRQPVRIVIDSNLRLCGTEKILNQGGAVWIYTLNCDDSKHKALKAAGADIIVLQQTDNKDQINLTQMMKHLATREINEIHTECGQSLAGALLKQQLVDELVIYVSPILLGSQARGAFELGELTDMALSPAYKIRQVRHIGDDLRITLTPKI